MNEVKKCYDVFFYVGGRDCFVNDQCLWGGSDFFYGVYGAGVIFFMVSMGQE